MPSVPTRLLLSSSLISLLVLASCGADIDEQPGGPSVVSTPDETRVADPRFEGEFALTSVLVDGQEIPLRTRGTITIETIFGGLRVDPGCNTYFGSFTLAESGQASFTVAGGSDEDCGELDSQEEAVLAALAAVRSWTETAEGFRFEGDGGQAITVSRGA